MTQGTSAVVPGHVRLHGRHVDVVPLDAALHGDDLYAGTHGSDERERVWQFLSVGPFPDRAAFDADLRRKTSTTDRLYHAIVDRATGTALGHATWMRIEPEHKVMEIGDILFTPRLQRTIGATEAMYLMARHVFETLGYRRYEWKCNALNEASYRAALRLGFVLEGTFRQHMIVKGQSRDTAWFSMLDGEWPSRKAAFERWLAPENFDAQGRQRQTLAALREG